MARLIDRDALLKDLKDYRIYDANTYYGFNCAVDAIKEAPTVDAVPVVRCKDCTHGVKNPILIGCVECYKYGSTMLKDDFCSKGERREDKNDNA